MDLNEINEQESSLKEISDSLISKAEIIENEITSIIDNDLDEEDFDILMNAIMDHTRPEAIAAFFAAKYYLDDEEKEIIIDSLKSKASVLAERTKKDNFHHGINTELLKNIFLSSRVRRLYNSILDK
jgi:hypothetical protein